MVYHGFRFTFAELLDDDACILIPRRHSREILHAVGSISQALAWVCELEKQTVFPFNLVVSRG